MTLSSELRRTGHGFGVLDEAQEFLDAGVVFHFAGHGLKHPGNVVGVIAARKGTAPQELREFRRRRRQPERHAGILESRQHRRGGYGLGQVFNSAGLGIAIMEPDGSDGFLDWLAQLDFIEHCHRLAGRHNSAVLTRTGTGRFPWRPGILITQPAIPLDTQGIEFNATINAGGHDLRPWTGSIAGGGSGADADLEQV